MARRLCLALAFVGLLAAWPLEARAQNREHQQIFADLRMLQEQTQLLRAAVAELAASLKAVNARVDEQANLTRKLFADQGVQIGALTDNARILREKLDATNVSLSKDAHEMETIRQEIANQRTLLNQIITMLTPPPAPVDPTADPTGATAAAATGAAGTGGTTTGTGAGATGTDPQTATPPVTPPPTPLAPPQNPDRVFNSAFGDYVTGRYDIAIQGFEYYIKSFPTSPEVPRARFHIAESQYGKGANKEAVTAYEEVITRHKGTEWESQALYKQGLAYEQLGQIERAKTNWERVRADFPDSSAAVLAQQALVRIIK